MAIVARCTVCSDEHPLGDRSPCRGTTSCPHCGDTSYNSRATAGTVTKGEAERITDAISDVYGVGEETKQNIVRTFSLYAELEAATVDDLVAIDNVGQKTAEAIVENT